MLMILAAVLLVQAKLFLCMPGQESEDTSLEDLCYGLPTKLTTRDDFENLLSQMDSEEFQLDFCENMLEALKAFKDVLGTSEEHVCTQKKINEFQLYYLKYLDTSIDSTTNRVWTQRKSVRDFVIAYAMQLSNLCKKNMVQLLQDADGLVADSDVEILLELTDEQNFIGEILKHANTPGDSVMPTDVSMTKSNKVGDKVLKLFSFQITIPSSHFNETSTESRYYKRMVFPLKNCGEMNYIKTICERKLKPIYGPLIMPMSYLARIGFNYKGKELEELLEDEEHRWVVTKWSNMAFLCELIETIEDIENKKLSQDEEEDEYDHIEKISYTPNWHVTIGDTIYDKNDKKLVSLIDSFNTGICVGNRRLFSFWKICWKKVVHDFKSHYISADSYALGAEPDPEGEESSDGH